MLNNKPVFQVGPLDQGWWPDGLLHRADRRGDEVRHRGDQEARLQHDPQAHQGRAGAVVLPCDKLGLLVWQDMPSGGMPIARQRIRPNAKDDAKFTEARRSSSATELKAMIDHLRNHPVHRHVGAVQRGLGPVRHRTTS